MVITEKFERIDDDFYRRQYHGSRPLSRVPVTRRYLEQLCDNLQGGIRGARVPLCCGRTERAGKFTEFQEPLLVTAGEALLA